MQNVGQSENRNIDKVNVQLDVVKSSTPQSSASSPAKSETETYSGAPAKYMTDSSESEDDSVSEILLACLCLSRPDLLAEMEEEGAGSESSKFLLSHDDPERAVDPEMQARLEALLEAAGIGKLSGEGKHLADPEVLRRLTSSVSCALDEAAAALTRMRSDQPPQHHRHHHQDKPTQCPSGAGAGAGAAAGAAGAEGAPSLAEACSDGDVGTVRKLLTEGRSVHETTEEGESLLSLACSAGYFELAQVLLAMHASVEDRGIKGDCTPLMEAASAGHVDIVRLLVAHGADANAVSGSGNTPLMYACAGGHEDCVRALLEHGANVEDHNENGHTPLMEAASAGHVGVAKILLEHGAGINTHSNEFKESALTLACYKGHLAMVRFLLEAGADREHKTDEMHTALMEASMDGHVEVARLLLDSGAQVNMPTDSFESPLTLAACGGHVELAMLLLERGANIEEVNDEGYTPLMEAAREGHEEMVALLLGQGASINAQTEETQETALTLACCGGFLEVADFLIKAGADAELGASTPLMEASQEGHIELVRYLVNAGADVHAQTQTGDTALTYACENGHTDVAELLLRAGAALEHESEGGRTPLMKACRAGHVCTVQFLVGKGADVNRMTANGDHTPLSLACAGGHVDVVKFLLACDADPFRKLKDNSTTLIEAAKGGHTAVVHLLLDYPHSVMLPRADCAGGVGAAVAGSAPAPAPTPPVAAVAPATATDGLSAAQAAALGLAHAAAPGQPAARALLPAHHQHHPPHAPHATHALQDLPPNFAKVYLDGRKKQPPAAGAPTGGAAGAAPPAAANPPPTLPNPAALAGAAPPAACPMPAKHKCPRKQRAAHAHPDHHLPPPPDILDEQIRHETLTKLSLPPGFTWKDIISKKCKGKDHVAHEFNRAEALASQPRNESLPETERNLLELSDAAGPPSLATSALHALDLQFCAQGVKTIHTPTTPPYPPPQQLFPVQQLAANLTQGGVVGPERVRARAARKCGKFGCKLLLLDALQRLGHHIGEHQLQELHQQQYQQLTAEHHAHFAQELGRVEGFVPQSEDAAVGAAGADPLKMGAVLAYMQREVPSLVALPPKELHSLMMQVMQQKSHEILSVKYEEPEEATGGLDPHTRRLLAAAEEALAADWPPRHELEPPPIQPHPSLEQAPQPPQPVATPPPTGTGTWQCRREPPAAPCQGPADEADPEFAAGMVVGVATVMREVHMPHAAPAPHPPHPPHQHHHPDHLKTAAYLKGYRDGRLTMAAGTAPAPHAKRDQPHHHTASVAVKKKQGRFGAARARGQAAGLAAAAEAAAAAPPAPAPAAYSAMDVDGETDSNRDTALTLACAGGHEDLVELLLSRGADIEHRDKKGFTPLILAATAGHEKIVEVLLNHGADIEAQSERTKDTPLSLACSGGRYEVVELILARGANKEHRNVSDYTPLSLAASGGYVNIIRLLLHHQAEINSRTGSKLGISPLMLAAMNGHTAAVRLLLDCGSDINAQIETNRNTALTLACFQGRHEVVSLLLDRKANVEHRAKTGLTPLMEAASGGYVEVGRVLLDKGADVNAPPVPSSRDTALTIAADKGHTKFVELLLQRRAAVEVKNKKGNSPLWLAANGGHLAVVEMLYAAGADIDSQDNRKVSCLMAAFRKGHTKVVKWMVGVVTQFPSDQEMTRYICTISDKELLEKCQECVRVIRAAKETQAARANQNATILLEELESERCREETRRQAALRRKERKKKKKIEKKTIEQEERRKLQEQNTQNAGYSDKALGECSEGGEPDDEPVPKEEGDSGIDANSQGSCSSSDVKAPPAASAKSKKKKKEEKAPTPPVAPVAKKQPDKTKIKPESRVEPVAAKPDKKQEKENVAPSSPPATPAKPAPERRPQEKKDKKPEEDIHKSLTVQNVKYASGSRKSQVFESTRLNVERDEAESGYSEKNKKIYSSHQWEMEGKTPSPKGATSGRREDGWKEVVRKSSVQTLSTVEPGCKKVSVASHAISRVIGRAGSNINAIRSATGAHIEVDKQSKGQGERIITIKGSGEATKQAAALIAAMIRDPDADIALLLPRGKLPAPAPPAPAAPKPPKQPAPKPSSANPSGLASAGAPAGSGSRGAARAPAKPHAPPPRAQPPRLQTHATIATPSGEKRTGSSGVPKAALSFTGAVVGARSNTFAAKLTATPPVDAKPRTVPQQPPPASPMPPLGGAGGASPPRARASPAGSEPEREEPWEEPAPAPAPPPAPTPVPVSAPAPKPLHINTQPQASSGSGAEYSLFKDASGGVGVWGAAGEPHHNVDPPPPQVDASKAPGYRGGGGGGGGCSPSSRTSSHGSTPPPAYHAPHAAHAHAHAAHAAHASHAHTPAPQHQPQYHQPMPIGNNVNAMDLSGLSRNGPIYPDNSRNGHNMMVSMAGGSVGSVGSVGSLGLGYVGVESRLNPRAPDFAQRHPLMHGQPKHNQQLFAGGSGSGGNLSTLLMSYQQPAAKHMPQPPHHPYQSLLERGVGVGVGGVGMGWAADGAPEEDRKPRPIGTERAWKLTAAEDWPHPMHHHQMSDQERYQNVSGLSGVGGSMEGIPGVGVPGVGGAGGVGGPGSAGGGGGYAGGANAGATAAALSLMHTLPLQYLPPTSDPHHQWDRTHHHNNDKQTWSKWTH